MSLIVTNPLSVLLLRSHRPSPLVPSSDVVSPWHVNESHTFTKSPNCSIGLLKFFMKELYQVPVEEQHWYHNKLTLTVIATKELADATLLSSLHLKEFTLVIQPPPLITHSYLKRLLNSTRDSDLQELLTQLQSIPPTELDLASIRETIVIPEKLMDVTIRNHKTGSFVDHIMIDGQQFLPHQIDPNSKLVMFRSKYSYQYSAASAEYAKEVKDANKKYETDLVHCQKLLHQLPIALVNSRQKLVEETKAVREKVPGMELSDLGALSVEQAVIADEITTQEERFSALKLVEFDRSKFTILEFQPQIELAFGWHQFNGINYELIHVPLPTDSEINALIHPNQQPISIKRTRQPGSK